MNKIKLLFLLAVAATTVSCSSIVLGIVKDRSLKGAVRLTDTVNNRQVIILRMLHLGTAQHYAEVRQYLDKRKAEGFVVFYEGIADIDPSSGMKFDSLQYDTLQRKLRRVMGLNFSGGYKNKENKSLPQMITTGLVMQNYDSLGINTDKDHWVDLTLGQAVEYYESRFDTIPLTQYDMTTPLNDRYKAPDNGNLSYYDFTDTPREQRLSDAVLRSKFDKIVIVWGGGHQQTTANTLQRSGFDKFEYAFLQKEAKAAKKLKK